MILLEQDITVQVYCWLRNNNTDFHFGLGWGTLDGSDDRFKNPLGYIWDDFNDNQIILKIQVASFKLQDTSQENFLHFLVSRMLLATK